MSSIIFDYLFLFILYVLNFDVYGNYNNDNNISKISELKKTSSNFELVLLLNGAADENRTHTGYPIRPSNVRVYQFRHGRNCLIIINNIYINFQHYFLVFDYILCKRHIKHGFHRLK